MKIAVSVVAPEVNAAFEPRFGRAAAFLMVDTDSQTQQAIVNPAAQLGSGAGIRAAEVLIRQGVEAVISGAFGPKAHDVLRAAHVEMYQGTSGTVSELIASLLQGDLKPVGDS